MIVATLQTARTTHRKEDGQAEVVASPTREYDWIRVQIDAYDSGGRTPVRLRSRGSATTSQEAGTSLQMVHPQE